MLLQAVVKPSFLSLPEPNQALPCSDSVQCVGSHYFYILILCYSTHQPAPAAKQAHIYVYMRVSMHVYMWLHKTSQRTDLACS